ncbi:anion transporter [bacterium]|nr:MAG: anion transporter [bacterium]
MREFLTTPVFYILFLVLALIVIRRINGLTFHIWQVMLLGALAALLTGSVTALAAMKSINFDIIFFLAGMFVVAEALCQSGYLYGLSSRFFGKAKTASGLIFIMILSLGFFSALLMNDTVAIIGTPLVLSFADKHNLPHKLMLLMLCFSITIGSVASPIGNPQNLLIAIDGGINNPFAVFMRFLFLPTLINLVFVYLILRFFYKDEFEKRMVETVHEFDSDDRLARLARLSLILIAVLIMLKTLAFFWFPRFDFALSLIAVIPALPVLIFSPKRLSVIRAVDWRTLVFFAALFVLMQAVWNSGLLEGLSARSGVDVTSVDVVLFSSVLISQVLSNVPFVAMYLPLIHGQGIHDTVFMALASGSTIAGNMFILGAASNVIVIQHAEKSGHTLTFFEFAKVGVPLTVINFIVYRLFLV